LRVDSEKLAEVARRVGTEGRVTNTNEDEHQNRVESASLFAPDVLSGDVPNHFPGYSQEKDLLRREVEEQDSEFRDNVTRIAKMLPLPPEGLAQFGARNVARAILAKCLGKGPGMTLTLSESGFSYSMPGTSGSTSGPPPIRVPPDLEAAFRTFTGFRPDPDVSAHCGNLIKRAARIIDSAKKLSAEARILAERITLAGTCEYTRLE